MQNELKEAFRLYDKEGRPYHFKFDHNTAARVYLSVSLDGQNSLKLKYVNICVLLS